MNKHCKFLLLFATLGLLVTDVTGAPVQRRGGVANTSDVQTSQNSAQKTNAATTNGARAAVRGRAVAPQSGNSGAAAPRAATPKVTARAATPQNTGKPVAARAATTENVINSGTRVTTAQQNIVVSQECQQKYDGCMDSFCMIENVNGGRCMCSNKNSQYDSILAEIEKLDQQSYQMATAGLDQIEHFIPNEPAPGAVPPHAQGTEPVKKKRNRIDLSAWATTDTSTDTASDTPNTAIQTGDALFLQSTKLCMEKIPECADKSKILQSMYQAKIRSDCLAYENSLKQQKIESTQKLQSTQSALREAALDKIESANKYDLGQCTIEFKKCMISTGGCGDDFTNCASVAATDNTTSGNKISKSYKIQGTATSIEISASTYDILESKRPLCDSVTNACVAVRDQVWDTFLRDVAPQLKSAELIAEDKARQDCIGNISSCFQTACKDNVDPNNPDGSYDLCLSRPATMLNVCKMPLEKCGINASSAAQAEKSQIWQYVVARLAAMRVNACTSQVKECLTHADRCGSDWSKCVGLDTDTIIRMCPYDKLTGCQQVYGDTDIRNDQVYDELADMIQGTMVNIDNKLLEFCQRAADQAMIKVCGTTTDCNALATNNETGAKSLNYQICWYQTTDKETTIRMDYCHHSADQIPDQELGRVTGSTDGQMGPVVPYVGVMTGNIYWDQLSIQADGTLTSIDEYLKNVPTLEPGSYDWENITNEINTIRNNINNTVQAIESDPTVQYCMTGRQVPGMRTPTDGDRTQVPRFPGLTQQMRIIIANSALQVAQQNYFKKYDELTERMSADYVKIAERQADIRNENAKDVRREAARISCINLANLSGLPKSPPPQGWGQWLTLAIVIAASVVVTVLTAGAGAPLTAAATIKVTALVAGSSITLAIPTGGTVLTAAGIAVTTAAVAGGAALIGGVAATAASSHDRGSVSHSEADLHGHYELDQWNFKQTIDTTFDWDTLECEKCVVTQNCDDIRRPMFGTGKCKRWADPQPTKCNTIQF